MGKTPFDQLRVLEWMCWLSGELHGQCFGGLFRPERFISDASQFGAIQQKARERIADCFSAIENNVSSGFAVGDALTAVDPYLLVFYRWGSRNAFAMAERYPRFTACIHGMVKHPAIVKAMADEGISL